MPKVLLVDDEPRVLRALAAVLRSKFHILTAENAKQARIIMQREKNISVLLSNQRMPGEKGHELLIWSKQNYPNCSRVMISGYLDSVTMQHAINEAEVFRVLAKPWDTKEVRNVMANAMLLNHANVRIPQLKKQKKLNDDKLEANKKCILAVLDADQEKKSIYQELSDDEQLNINFYRSVDELYYGLKAHHETNILFVDTNIGEKAAIDVFEKIRINRPNMVSIAVTEACMGADAVTMLNNGQIFKYLIKPLTVTRLKPMLLACLQKHEQKYRERQVIADQLSESGQQGKPYLFWQKISQLWH